MGSEMCIRDRAKRARKLYHAIGGPTVENFKKILRQNLIHDCPVTEKDVTNAEKIFGPDIGTLKGRTTKRKPAVARDDEIDIPPDLVKTEDDLTYCMDIMFVNGMPMLTGIDKSIRYRALVPLENRTADEIYGGLDKILRVYNKADFYFGTIRCDREFKPLMESVEDNLDIEMDYPPAEEHVPEACLLYTSPSPRDS